MTIAFSVHNPGVSPRETPGGLPGRPTVSGLALVRLRDYELRTKEQAQAALAKHLEGKMLAHPLTGIRPASESHTTAVSIRSKLLAY